MSLVIEDDKKESSGEKFIVFNEIIIQPKQVIREIYNEGQNSKNENSFKKSLPNVTFSIYSLMYYFLFSYEEVKTIQKIYDYPIQIAIKMISVLFILFDILILFTLDEYLIFNLTIIHILGLLLILVSSYTNDFNIAKIGIIILTVIFYFFYYSVIGTVYSIFYCEKFSFQSFTSNFLANILFTVYCYYICLAVFSFFTTFNEFKEECIVRQHEFKTDETKELLV